ncbi:MAG: glutathione S-transferase [Myxococcales bacterium FL481]|nr:MAG: glutathione S-transferase [Myxococcales bacterium FL481]
MSIVLHGSFTSPFVRHCRVALAQSGLHWAFEPTSSADATAVTPAMRVPFLRADGRLFTDSSVILQYVRERQGRRFLADLEDAQLYHLANAALDSAVNLFLLSKNDRTPDNTPYLKRQRDRVVAAISALADAQRPDDGENDAALRIACFVDWARYRKLYEIEQPSLLSSLARLNQDDAFASTHPSRSDTAP